MGFRLRIFRSFRDYVQLGTLLAFVAGNINSIAFVQFGTYVSHVSGHATYAAITYAEGDLTAAFLFFTEFMAFILGAGFTAFLLRGSPSASSPVKYTSTIFIELALIVLYLGLVLVYRQMGGLSHYFSHLTLILAVAMGMQNAMLRQASGTLVRTTHITGVATDFGVAFGGALRHAYDAFRGQALSLRERFRLGGQVFAERLRRSGFLLHGFIILAFSSGAVIGTITYLLYRDLALLTPILVLLVLGCREYRRQLPV